MHSSPNHKPPPTAPPLEPSESASPVEAEQRLIQSLIAWRSQPGDARAVDDLWTAVRERLRFLASKLLATSPQVRRWEETDDLVQNASIRLLEALKAATIESDRHLLNLAAKKVREEFIDKLRHYGGPRSPMRNHATNSERGANGERLDLVGQAAAESLTSATESDRWQRFHTVVNGLPGTEREVFEMVWYLGAEQEAIARTLRCSVPTVKRIWKSAKTKIEAATECPRSA